VDNHNNAGIASSRGEVLSSSTTEASPVHARKRAMTIHVSQTSPDTYEAAVEDAIKVCDGDMRGALKALIIANEFLERDLQELMARKHMAY
jgi:hypothetical protein